jgi:membrane protease YdiL (CAAX protease family)
VQSIQRFPLLSFFVLAYFLTWVIEVPVLLGAKGILPLHLPQWMEAVAAFGPFVAALVVLKCTHGSHGISKLMASLCRWRVPGSWFAATLISPFLILLAALFISGETDTLFNGNLWDRLSAEGRLAEVFLFGGLLRGLGEEPGWRGFALPRLRGRSGPLLATLLLWPVWLLWHLPSMLMRPEFSLAAWLGFAVGLLAAALILTLIYERTGSVLMVAIWHALINITRGIAASASTESFFAFAQVTLLVGVLIIVYWTVFSRSEGAYELG